MSLHQLAQPGLHLLRLQLPLSPLLGEERAPQPLVVGLLAAAERLQLGQGERGRDSANAFHDPGDVALSGDILHISELDQELAEGDVLLWAQPKEGAVPAGLPDVGLEDLTVDHPSPLPVQGSELLLDLLLLLVVDEAVYHVFLKALSQQVGLLVLEHLRPTPDAEDGGCRLEGLEPGVGQALLGRRAAGLILAEHCNYKILGLLAEHRAFEQLQVSPLLKLFLQVLAVAMVEGANPYHNLKQHYSRGPNVALARGLKPKCLGRHVSQCPADLLAVQGAQLSLPEVHQLDPCFWVLGLKKYVLEFDVEVGKSPPVAVGQCAEHLGEQLGGPPLAEGQLLGVAAGQIVGQQLSNHVDVKSVLYYLVNFNNVRVVERGQHLGLPLSRAPAQPGLLHGPCSARAVLAHDLSHLPEGPLAQHFVLLVKRGEGLPLDHGHFAGGGQSFGLIVSHANAHSPKLRIKKQVVRFCCSYLTRLIIRLDLETAPALGEKRPAKAQCQQVGRPRAVSIARSANQIRLTKKVATLFSKDSLVAQEAGRRISGDLFKIIPTTQNLSVKGVCNLACQSELEGTGLDNWLVPAEQCAP